MIDIIRQAWLNQYKARTRYIEPEETERLEKEKKYTTACLRFSAELAELVPYLGEFEIEEFKLIRRKVDQVDNVYIWLKSI